MKIKIKKQNRINMKTHLTYSIYCNYTYLFILYSNLIMALAFTILISTEFDLTTSFEVSSILTSIFDKTVFDNDKGITRMDINNAEDIYSYLKDFMLPNIFDEI
jgi:hypothetical protein